MAASQKMRLFLKRTFDLRSLLRSFISVEVYTDKFHSCCGATAGLGKHAENSDLKPKDSDGIEWKTCSAENFPDKHVSLSNLQITEDELSQCPIERFTGNIYVVKEPSDERKFEILAVLNMLREEKVLGFDVEMTESNQVVDLKRNKKTRVVQIASETDAVVWQLKNFVGLPSSLVFFLKSDILKVQISPQQLQKKILLLVNLCKVGHAISDDVVLLKKEFNIRSRCLFDTLPWAMELNCKPLGLHALCAIFLGWRISKGLRTSDWNRTDLSENQIHYACTDAWASLLLYKKMKSVASQNGNTLPLPIASVNDILDTRLLSKRKRRSRLVQNNKARKNVNIMAETALKVVE